jgi:shikimate dehydrogenase
MTGDFENKTPIDKKFISKNHICFDVIYKPEKTKFLLDAEKKGAKIINGEKMLIYQGKMARDFWLKK